MLLHICLLYSKIGRNKDERKKKGEAGREEEIKKRKRARTHTSNFYKSSYIPRC